MTGPTFIIYTKQERVGKGEEKNREDTEEKRWGKKGFQDFDNISEF